MKKKVIVVSIAFLALILLSSLWYLSPVSAWSVESAKVKEIRIVDGKTGKEITSERRWIFLPHKPCRGGISVTEKLLYPFNRRQPTQGRLPALVGEDDILHYRDTAPTGLVHRSD